MGKDTGECGPGGAGPMHGRRDFLRKAAVASTTAFAVPMIVTVDPADAQAVASPPPEPPGSSVPVAPPARGANLALGGVTTPGRPSAPGRAELPRTGANLDRLLAAGLAATAGGAALVLWSADRKANPKPTFDAPEPPDPEAAT